MYPPLPFLNRECSKDWRIPGTNSVIKKDTFVFIPVHAVHHDAKYYPEPEKFKPERFSPANCAGKSFIEMPYMPFGTGPRNCIAMRLGKMQTKVGLVLMLQNHVYTLTGNTKRPLTMCPKSVLMTPIGGIELKVNPRNPKQLFTINVIN